MLAAKLRTVILAATATLVASTQAVAQAPKTRDELVRDDLANFGVGDAWIYNDVARGFATARRTSKPLLVVFRCIPCEACAQLDHSIVERDAGVQKLLDKYVCVRVVHANGMDLGLFQFDYDQSFAAFLMNGDGTIYARYGTRSHQTRSEDDVSLEGFAEALEAGLQLHAGYPGNKSALAGKQPQGPPNYATPEQYPPLKEFASKLDYEGKVAASCIHCHQVGESLHAVLRDQGEPIPDKALFPYPHPKLLGLIMDPRRAAVVKRVEPGSPAVKAGFQAGDEILSLAGQPMASLADMQWVLHHAGDSAELRASVRRDGGPVELTLALAQGWRTRGDISWRATSWQLRRMTTGGLRLDEAPPAIRADYNLADDQLAILVTHVGEYDEHAHAKRQGFLKNDVIVSIAGESQRMRESDVFALLVNKPVGEEIPVTVLRGPEQIELSLMMQK